MSNGSRRGDGWPSRISITPSGAAVCSNSDCCDVILVTVVVHIARAGEAGETSLRKTLGTELATVHNAIILGYPWGEVKKKRKRQARHVSTFSRHEADYDRGERVGRTYRPVLRSTVGGKGRGYAVKLFYFCLLLHLLPLLLPHY